MARITRKPDYRDLDLDFFAHPTTGDVVKKTGVEAIKRSIRNLVLMHYYDKKFQSWIGSDAVKLLFENINPLTATFLKNAVVQVITNFEPRAQLMTSDAVQVSVDADNNGYNVRIEFVEVNRGEPVVMTVFLERLR